MRKLKIVFFTLLAATLFIVFNGTASAAITPFISYQSHVENIGWQGWVSNVQTAGTVGQGLRVEAFKLELQSNGFSNSSIQYRAHVENVGWQNWGSDDSIAGTVGQGLRVEAVQVKLQGDISQSYDMQYRAHVENIGWQNWVSNGDTAGTIGQGLRVEAFEVRLVPKSASAAPVSSAEQTLLNNLNTKRRSLGLNPVILDHNLSTIAKSRAGNAVANGGLPVNHFTTNGEVVGIGWSPNAMIDAWYNETNMLGAPGHRLWVANPKATAVGFGIVGNTIVGESNVGQY